MSEKPRQGGGIVGRGGERWKLAPVKASATAKPSRSPYRCTSESGGGQSQRTVPTSALDSAPAGSDDSSTGTTFPVWWPGFLQDDERASSTLTTSESYVSYTPTRQPHPR